MKRLPVLLAVLALIACTSHSKLTAPIPLTMTEVDGFKQQVRACLVIPEEYKESHIVVTVGATFTKDGAIKYMQVINADKASYMQDPAYKAMADLFMAALRKCSPYQGLPEEKYDTWKYMELRFIPSAWEK